MNYRQPKRNAFENQSIQKQSHDDRIRMEGFGEQLKLHGQKGLHNLMTPEKGEETLTEIFKKRRDNNVKDDTIHQEIQL